MKTVVYFLICLFPSCCLFSQGNAEYIIAIMHEQGIKVPISARKANKTQAPFECPICLKELILKKGDVRRPYFSHKPGEMEDAVHGNGAGESYEHKIAKALIIKNLEKYQFVINCPCGRQIDILKFIPSIGFSGKEEYRLDPFVIDVMVFDQLNEEIAAIEVFHTHKVDDEKTAFLKRKNIRLLEIHAQDIIESEENDSFKITVMTKEKCQKCIQAEKRKMLRPCSFCNQWRLINDCKKLPFKIGKCYLESFACTDSCYDRIMEEYCICIECLRWGNKNDFHALPICGGQTEIKFACKNCYSKCSNCGEYYNNKNGNCPTCEADIWVVEVEDAIQEKNLQKLNALIVKTPIGTDNSRAKTQYKTLSELIIQKKVIIWNQQVDNAIGERNLSQLEGLLNRRGEDYFSKIDPEKFNHARIECIRMKEQRAQEKAEEEKLLKLKKEEQQRLYQEQLNARAKEIVESDRVDLVVSYGESPEVRKYGARWEGGDNFSVKVCQIRNCAKWFKEDQRIIDIIEALLKKQILEKTKIGRKRKQKQDEDDNRQTKITKYIFSQKLS